MGRCLHIFLRLPEVQQSSRPSDLEYDLAIQFSFGDVHLDNTMDPQFLEVTIKASKTDLLRQGVPVYLEDQYRPMPGGGGAELHGV